MQAERRDRTPTPAPTTTSRSCRIDPADVGKVNPSVPGFGGPTGVGGPSATGADVYSYGNSSLRFGITQLSPKQGIVVDDRGQRLEPHRLHGHAGHPG